MNSKTLRILLKKEVLLLRRNPLIPRIIVMLPLMAMLVLPLVANLDVKSVSVAVVDNDCTELSRRIVADMEASEYLSVETCVFQYDAALRSIEEGRADAILVIPRKYSTDMTNGLNPQLLIDANGVNATKGMLGARYAAESATQTLQKWRAESGERRGINQNRQTTSPFLSSPSTQHLNTLHLYNPTLNFRNYMIPALMVVLIIIICGFLPTLNIVSEKETGTIEAMNVTPVGKFTFVLSKLIPYWFAGLIVVTVGMLIGWLVYGLVPAGNIGSIYHAAVLFSLVMSGLGVTIANKSATMLQSIFVMFAFIMIFQLMGGLFTPISSMPEWAQWITYGVPPRYFIEIMRAVYLKGAGISDLWSQYLSLACFALFFCSLAWLTYQKRS